MELCQPVAGVASRQHLRSATQQLLVVPRHQLSCYGRRSLLCDWSVGLEFPAGRFAESGYWRKQFQTISEDVSVRNVLMIQCIRGFTTMRYINRLFTYLLSYTYLLTYTRHPPRPHTCMLRLRLLLPVYLENCAFSLLYFG